MDVWLADLWPRGQLYHSLDAITSVTKGVKNMGTTIVSCGCIISSNMLDEIVYVFPCLKHSVMGEVHLARKELSKVTGGVETPDNYQDPEVQEKLVVLANAVRNVERR